MEKKPPLDFSKLRNRKLVINVTARDVARARDYVDTQCKAYSVSCPVALAATRALRARFRRHPHIAASVGPDDASIYIQGREGSFGSFKLTSALQRIVYKFDAGTGVRPTQATVLLTDI